MNSRNERGISLRVFLVRFTLVSHLYLISCWYSHSGYLIAVAQQRREWGRVEPLAYALSTKNSDHRTILKQGWEPGHQIKAMGILNRVSPVKEDKTKIGKRRRPIHYILLSHPYDDNHLSSL